MNTETLIRKMRECRTRVTGILGERIDEIIALCEPYAGLGYSFTFSSLPDDIEDMVDAVLVALSDQLLEDFSHEAQDVMEEDDDGTVMPLVLGDTYGMTAQERLDMQCSRLRHVLEGWLAIAFVQHADRNTAKKRILHYLQNPFGSEDWATAYEERGRYAASIIRDGDRNRKPGLSRSMIAAIALVGEEIINSASKRSAIRHLGIAGTKYYGVRRGSSFPCPICDEVCMHVYPVSQVVLPVHPRCMCVPYPVDSDTRG